MEGRCRSEKDKITAAACTFNILLNNQMQQKSWPLIELFQLFGRYKNLLK